ncbi:hypothetical protein ABIF63_003569 [Bradyrhizobium japonicum]|uniref:Uncharacterized protein n=1 Tax=Bradyrhizobium japonicum TaxID=375 RepID=A0ABV2RRA5_BRAJP|nr:hypothetical protein [Bradyrhizobium japonicum]
MMDMPQTKRDGKIEMKLRRVSQLLHTLDPSPFRESDLAVEAEEYIVGRALELPKGAPIRILIYLPTAESAQDSKLDIAGAIRNYFDLRSQAVTREMRELFKTGRLSLVIGVTVLSACLLLGWLFAQRVSEGPISRIISERFLIFGWVAIWKPSEIFLYAWPPLRRRRKLYRRLADANVSLHADATLK